MEIVCGAIQIDHKFFIAKRGKGVDEGIWEFPGGKVEKGETYEQAVLRELKEELEVDVRVLHKICKIEDVREKVILHVHAYLCEIVAGEIHLHVHDQGKIVAADELYQYNFQEADVPILDELNKK